MRPWIVVLFAYLVASLSFSPSRACVNDIDSDSLALQAKKLPDTLRVITGRFDRNPPLYYQMRIRRSLARLKQNPRQFGLYDDIGAAYDRLHHDDEALQIMERKRSLLPAFNAKNPPINEAWYRYYANAGTFRAHRFLGAKAGDLKEMKQARAYIAHAIRIKPNAHFGRERYQLMAMDWMIAVRERKGKNIGRLGDWIYDRDHWDEDWKSKPISPSRKDRAVEGLSGLIVLGAAWQSVDIFQALGSALDNERGVTLRHLALLRCIELFQEGHTSQAPRIFNKKEAQLQLKRSEYLVGIGVNKENQTTLNALFPRLRSEAERWNQQRQKYMLARLAKGRHPDTDAHFWDDWRPDAPPSLEVIWSDATSRQQAAENKNRVAVLILALPGLSLIVGWMWRMRRSARHRAEAW